MSVQLQDKTDLLLLSVYFSHSVHILNLLEIVCHQLLSLCLPDLIQCFLLLLVLCRQVLQLFLFHLQIPLLLLLLPLVMLDPGDQNRTVRLSLQLHYRTKFWHSECKLHTVPTGTQHFPVCAGVAFLPLPGPWVSLLHILSVLCPTILVHCLCQPSSWVVWAPVEPHAPSALQSAAGHPESVKGTICGHSWNFFSTSRFPTNLFTVCWPQNLT